MNDTWVCPLCHSRNFVPWKLGLMQCESCQVVVSPIIFQQKANERLEKEWFGEVYKPYRSFWVSQFETWNNCKTLARLDRANPPGHRLLEIGVGSGAFLNAARQQGYEVMGCDLSDAICKRVRSTYGIVMHCASLETLADENRFDIVVMNHVLEHVQQPVEFLKEAIRLLAAGGVTHIAVPNVACWEAYLSGWTSFEPYHLTYFTPETLRRAVIGAGFKIEAIKTHDSFSGWFLALLRTGIGLNRESGAVTRPVESLASRGTGSRSFWLGHAYRMAMLVTGGGIWPLRLLQARLGRGDEMICIARKTKELS